MSKETDELGERLAWCRYEIKIAIGKVRRDARASERSSLGRIRAMKRRLDGLFVAGEHDARGGHERTPWRAWGECCGSVASADEPGPSWSNAVRMIEDGPR